MPKAILTENKKFRKQGGSNYVAVKNVPGCLEITDTDTYTAEYHKNKIVLTKKSETK